MLKRVVRFIARRVIPEDFTPPAVTVNHATPDIAPLDFEPGLRDSTLSGWFNSETGELFAGFPISADDTVVDVGCGDGGNSIFCSRQGAKVIFADISEERVAQTAAKMREVGAHDAVPLVSNADPLPLGDAIASKVICTEVIEHVESPARFLAELVRIGKPGAQYLITVPDPEAEKLQKHFAPASYFEHPNHIRIIERSEFREMIEQSGLIVEKEDSYGFYWTMWWCLFWACEKQDFAAPWHPLLQHWMQAWGHFLKTPNGPRIKRVFDSYLPKSQLIIARKPY